jgi:two-component system response regulator NreC
MATCHVWGAKSTYCGVLEVYVVFGKPDLVEFSNQQDQGDNVMITVLIADDHSVARAGIRRILEEDPSLEIVGEAEDGHEARKMVDELRPDVLLLDLKMPGPRPAEIERWVRMNYPDIVTLVLTAHDRDIYLAEMYHAGVSGYFSKSTRGDQLIKAIHRAVKGEDLFKDEQKSRVARWQKEDGHIYETLTDQERKVLLLICKGLDNDSISKQLRVTHRTVAFHVTNILEKLGVKSRQQAVAWAHQEFGDDLEILLK